MCGICGFITQNHIELPKLRAMNDFMIRRGPNDNGEEIFYDRQGNQVGLAQRRLSIIDLSSKGHQPMHSYDNNVEIVFNGEIFNFLDLKSELKDYPYMSTTDTEVIIAAYLKWGISFVDKLNGMFAFCLYDKRKSIMYLVRDRFGVKPLYYWHGIDSDGKKALIFASELRPIMAYPTIDLTINRTVLPRYLYQQYINAPFTIFEDTYKVEPGCIVTVSDNIEIKTDKYWDVASTYHKCQCDTISDFAVAKQELVISLRQAIERRLISDVSLGAFLSGGYDSSLVVAVAQEILGAEPLNTFSIGFYEDKYNEANYARAIASHLHTNHTEMYIDEKTMLGLVESIYDAYDEPMADASEIPTMLVSKLAKEYVTVSLSGDAGDELFCGYGLYDRIFEAQKLDRIGAIVHQITQFGNIESHLPFKIRAISENRNPETSAQFGDSNGYSDLAAKMVLKPKKQNFLDTSYPVEGRYQIDNWQIRRMLLDLDSYLPGDIMCKVDRASMFYSLESRCPLLDRDFVELSFRIDHSLKYTKEGDKKHILKSIVHDYIPYELMNRPKKGFGVPLDKWLRGPLRGKLLAFSDISFLTEQGLFDVAFTSSLIEDYLKTGDSGSGTGNNLSRLVWSFYVFQQWYGHYIIQAKNKPLPKRGISGVVH